MEFDEFPAPVTLPLHILDTETTNLLRARRGHPNLNFALAPLEVVERFWSGVFFLSVLFRTHGNRGARPSLG